LARGIEKTENRAKSENKRITPEVIQN